MCDGLNTVIDCSHLFGCDYGRRFFPAYYKVVFKKQKGSPIEKHYKKKFWKHVRKCRSCRNLIKITERIRDSIEANYDYCGT